MRWSHIKEEIRPSAELGSFFHLRPANLLMKLLFIGGL
jgi:hypothetical protein